MGEWLGCKNILCIRADNMGDLLLSSPAIAALKTTFSCKVTVLTSSQAKDIVSLLPDIDEVIEADLPWVKLGDDPGKGLLLVLINKLNALNFDGCVIFGVYSQNSLPAAMLAYLAGIPLRLGYCRENPYHLLTNWIPDAEPYFYIRHQVERDLELVGSIGAVTADKRLRLKLNTASWTTAQQKALSIGVDLLQPFFLLHPGVSEEKRQYPSKLWIATGKLLTEEFSITMLVTGTAKEKSLTDTICAEIGANAKSLAGMFNLEEFAMLIRHAMMIISVNTATIHLAAALNKPMVVLYAQSNPQHTPWMVNHQLLEYSIPRHLQSKNQVIRYVNGQYYMHQIKPPQAVDIVNSVKKLLQSHK